MSRKDEIKFKVNKNEQSETEGHENISFFPKYNTRRIFHKHLRVTWFEADFCQSKYTLEKRSGGSNACTLIAILTAAKCYFNKIQIQRPEKSLNSKIIHAFAYGMLTGNCIYDDLKTEGVLSNINLTVPEAIQYAGNRVAGLHEWKSVLYPQPLALTLFENLKSLWLEWHHNCLIKKKFPDLYVILICDSRSVLFIMQNELDTVSLIDSHQHSYDEGAFIATTSRNKLKILCNWFSDLIYHCYKSYPYMYELSLLYFRNGNKC